ncbi:MAG: carboxypeptidase-like regulatory domain-containing protein [Alistipes sp.]|nr:carboxypeptidase-like regulatory domain-containing protein [Alistipes sp.]
MIHAKTRWAICLLTLSTLVVSAQEKIPALSGKIISKEKEEVAFATVYLKGTTYGCSSDQQGMYYLHAPAGKYTLAVSAVGYEAVEKPVTLTGERLKMNIVLTASEIRMDEVVVTASGVGRVNRSPFNAVAIGTKELQNSTKSLSEALAKTPGMKLRESGGVGSDMSLLMDGFSGKHIKIFIDGVPQEGVGDSFGLNNIPVNFAERIEIYKGVVPVGLGSDALGGAINIVTDKSRRGWYLDASYSYGSFNTHKSYVNFGQTFDCGLMYEINAFQNYSDNSYKVDTPVEEFFPDGTSVIDTDKSYRVRRFNDTYHNEAVTGKIGVVDRKWADRLVFAFTYSHMYKEIQTGVVQKVVFGQKHRKGYSLMPSLEYSKHNFLTQGLDLTITANYNDNIAQHIDTAAYRYNWFGEKRYLNGTLGEQSYQNTRSENDNWNATITARYRLGRGHTFTLSHVFNAITRANSQAAGVAQREVDAFDKTTRKNITGLSYQLMPSEKWNLSVFGKYYNQYNAGPVSTSENGTTDYVLLENNASTLGFGAAGTYFFLRGAQAKLSYERACRLPTTEELFGDEDLELGTIGLKPERSDNVNLSLSYDRTFGLHGLYAEAGLVYRNTADYIQRRIGTYSGNKSYASYSNHGKVETKGYNLSLRYSYRGWLSVGGSFTQMDVRDRTKTLNEGSVQTNLTYGDRIPNQPYLFANSDVTFYWRNLFGRGNTLSVAYDNFWQHDFPLYSESLGAKESKQVVPAQFAHSISLTYSLKQGRYNFSLECRNLTDEKLYDNFSLQKAGRAFYGKVRVRFGDEGKNGRHGRGEGRHRR